MRRHITNPGCEFNCDLKRWACSRSGGLTPPWVELACPFVWRQANHPVRINFVPRRITWLSAYTGWGHCNACQDAGIPPALGVNHI